MFKSITVEAFHSITLRGIYDVAQCPYCLKDNSMGSDGDGKAVDEFCPHFIAYEVGKEIATTAAGDEYPPVRMRFQYDVPSERREYDVKHLTYRLNELVGEGEYVIDKFAGTQLIKRYRTASIGWDAPKDPHLQAAAEHFGVRHIGADRMPMRLWQRTDWRLEGERSEKGE
jgi:hypothetical protein